MTLADSTFEASAHVCHLFRDFDDQRSLVLPFLKEGLEQNEFCIYIANELPIDDWVNSLEEYGVAVQQEIERGALGLISGDGFRQVSESNSVARARVLWRLISDNLERFSGVRIIGDAGWALEPPLAVEALCHWEATATTVYEGVEVRAVCQYRLERHSPSALYAALTTHPWVVLDGELHLNPYEDGRSVLRNEDNLEVPEVQASTVEGMLDTIRGMSGRND